MKYRIVAVNNIPKFILLMNLHQITHTVAMFEGIDEDKLKVLDKQAVTSKISILVIPKDFEEEGCNGDCDNCSRQSDYYFVSISGDESQKYGVLKAHRYEGAERSETAQEINFCGRPKRNTPIGEEDTERLKKLLDADVDTFLKLID